MKQQEINKIKKALIQNGFLKIEGTMDDENIYKVYEYDPKLKSEYRVKGRFVGEWEFTKEALRFKREEGHCDPVFKILESGRVNPNI